MITKNYLPEADFEGFSPNNMHGLLYSTFDEKNSPLMLAKEIDEKLISNIDFNSHVLNFLTKIKKEQPLKLTQKGNLSRKFCSEFLQDNFTDDSSKAYMEKHPIMKEEDSYYIKRINILTKLAGFTKKVHGKISLTNKCNKLLDGKSLYQIYKSVFLIYTRKFNWGYFDLYPESPIIQNGFGFSIYLVQKYATNPREAVFFSDKFLRAFPITINEFPDTHYSEGKNQFQSCYYIRTFDRFLHSFGLVEIKKKGKFPSEKRFIKKKELLDHLIKWRI